MFVIGIVGISCAGKTFVSRRLQEALGGADKCLLISMDDYYKELTEEQQKVLYEDQAEINFDEPNAINFEFMTQQLNDIIYAHKTVQVPKFDPGSCIVTGHVKVEPGKHKFCIIEGVFIFCNEEISRMCDLKIWVEAREYVCALRRFIKYSEEMKGYSPIFVYNQCIRHVLPGSEAFLCCIFKHKY
jgi:uridine kinase